MSGYGKGIPLLCQGQKFHLWREERRGAALVQNSECHKQFFLIDAVSGISIRGTVAPKSSTILTPLMALPKRRQHFGSKSLQHRIIVRGRQGNNDVSHADSNITLDLLSNLCRTSGEHPPTLVFERPPRSLRIIRKRQLQQYRLLNHLRVTSNLAAMLGQHGDFPLNDL